MISRRPATTPQDAAARPTGLSFGALQGIVGFHVARAAVTTYDLFDKHLARPFELRKVEFSLLMLLLANEAIAPKRLARALAVTAPNLTLLLDRLQQRGLLKRVPNPLDGRSQHVVLTDKGLRLAREAEAAAGPMERELLARLSPAEHAMLIELLGKLAGRPLPA
jgi:DNA-binding MarR family transcriptional regulator